MTPQYRTPMVVAPLKPGVAGNLIKFATECGIDLEPWQVRLIESMEESR